MKTRERFTIRLRKREKEKLDGIIKRGRSNARKITRARILLMKSEDQTNEEVSRGLRVSLRTVTNVISRYKEGGLSRALNDQPRPGAPRIIDGIARAKITALACTTPDEGNGQWSLRLLADKVVELGFVESISAMHVGRILKKTK